jgi:hypothetical protein
MTRRTRIAALVFVISVGGAYALLAAPSGPRSIRQFEPAQLASLELEMWQAYYAKENVRLFRLLVVMLREQYNYSWATATREAFYLARAAATFGNARSNYEVVLPDLETAYTIARDWTSAAYQPAAVARAELAWWMARRVPGQNSPDEVGKLIAEEYALLYDVPPEALLESAVLRARAGALRDSQAPKPDWTMIERLLLHSYQSLHRVVGQ